MLWALVTGFAGVEDMGRGFDSVRLSPRWPAADVQDASVQTTYENSGKGFGYEYRCRNDGVDLGVVSSGSEILFHILLPAGRSVASVSVDGEETASETSLSKPVSMWISLRLSEGRSEPGSTFVDPRRSECPA